MFIQKLSSCLPSTTVVFASHACYSSVEGGWRRLAACGDMHEEGGMGWWRGRGMLCGREPGGCYQSIPEDTAEGETEREPWISDSHYHGLSLGRSLTRHPRCWNFLLPPQQPPFTFFLSSFSSSLSLSPPGSHFLHFFDRSSHSGKSVKMCPRLFTLKQRTWSALADASSLSEIEVKKT